tara:strand:- start:5282 stop:6550 length:1269 start_codon:yes stop_codon:yes gene_type:complete
MKKTIALLLFSAYISSEILIHTSNYIDGVNDRVLKKASIVVGDDGRIKSISSGYKNSNGYEYFDLRDFVVMPGLMDMHVHFGQQNVSKAEKPEKVEKEYSAIAAVKHARMTLDGGFTTVRQVGDSGFIAISLRDAIKNGDAVGPRIFAAGKSLATTGGHADPTNGRAFGDYVYPDPESGVVNGPYEVFAGVRQRYKDGADGIKITVTGGVMSLAKSGDNPQFTQEEANAVVQAAKDYGFWVAVHAHGAEGMKRAIRAGVDSIEHGTYMDDEAMDLMIENGTYLVPTISAGEYVAEMSLIDGFFPEIVRPKARAVGPQIGGTFGKAYNRGVNIAFGTDVGVQAHGTNWKEFVYMVQYGMPMMKAIQSATMETAKLLRIEEDLGSLEVGKIADIIAIDGNPLDNPADMKNVVFVMKEGKIYKQN